MKNYKNLDEEAYGKKDIRLERDGFVIVRDFYCKHIDTDSMVANFRRVTEIDQKELERFEEQVMQFVEKKFAKMKDD